MSMTQKAVRWFLTKAVGFPPWGNQTYSLTDPSLGLMLSGNCGGSVSGLSVLQLSDAWSCISILAKVCGSFPITVVESNGDISQKVSDQVADLLNDPNEYMDSMQLLEAMLVSFNIFGHSFVEKVSLGSKVTSLWPLDPVKMRVLYQGGQLSYEYSMTDGKSKKLKYEDIIHVRNMSIDGVNGLSAVDKAREVFGRALAANNYGASYFRNSGRPDHVIEVPPGQAPKTPEGQKRLREGMAGMHSGSENSGKTMFLYDGMKFVAISDSPDKSQFIETSKLGTAQIAAMYGVPLNLLAMSDKSATYASAEQFNRYFVDYTVGPLCIRFEKALTKALLGKRPNRFVKFNLDALLRGDSKTRAEYLGMMTEKGLMTPNEARAKENLEPLAGGDELIIQSNMTVLDALKLIVANNTRPQIDPNAGKSTQNISLNPEITVKTKMDSEQMTELTDTIKSNSDSRVVRKTGKATRLEDGSMQFEIEERIN